MICNKILLVDNICWLNYNSLGVIKKFSFTFWMKF